MPCSRIVEGERVIVILCNISEWDYRIARSTKFLQVFNFTHFTNFQSFLLPPLLPPLLITTSPSAPLLPSPPPLFPSSPPLLLPSSPPLLFPSSPPSLLPSSPPLLLPLCHPPPPHTCSNGYYISSSASVSVGSTSIGPARSSSSHSGTVEEILMLLTKQMEAYTLPVDIW